MKMRFLPDTPIRSAAEDEQGLQFGPFVDLIARSLQTTEAPFVYGVLGDWGTGKTSILRILQETLTTARNRARPNERTFVPIWFNAWKYENEANIIYPLLYAIKRQYERDVDHTPSATFKDRFIDVAATSAFALGDIGLRAATHTLTGQALKLAELKTHLEEVRQHKSDLEAVLTGWANEVDTLETAFRALLQSYAEDYAAQRDLDPTLIRFVILIDDLDRCLPETTITILEGIKNYLAVDGSTPETDLSRAIFVLALNAKVVYQGIRAKYKGLEIDGREYLEKILNYSFYVPEPELARVEAFATARLGDLLVEAGDRDKVETYLSEFGQVLAECHFNNPRKIKRILNRYLLLISEYEEEIRTKAFKRANVVRLLVLAEYYAALFSLLYSRRDKEGNLHRLINELKKANDYAQLKEEQAPDLSIPVSYPPLFILKPLFVLAETNLAKELEAVFRLTRMI